MPFSSSGWSYYRGTAAPTAAWKTAAAGWPTGVAPLGFGADTGTLGTRIPNTLTTKPLATYFQKSFTLDAIPATGITLTSWADDGVVIFANGTEVARKNLPSGPVKHGGYATIAPQSAKARASTFSVTIPASALVVGRNVLAAQVQSNWRATPNITFDARLTMQAPAPLAPAPVPAPPVTAPPVPAPPVTAPPVIAPPATGPAAAWGTPAWQDDFTYIDPATGQPAIDPTKWNVRDRSDLGLLFDTAVPTASQVTVDSSGIAHLRGEWLDAPAERSSGTSGPALTHKTGYMDQRRLESGDVSYGQQYGRWEIRAKTPTGPKTYGALAAFWLRNDNSGEIDIMEAWGYNEQAAKGGQRIDTSTTTVHTHTSSPDKNQKFFTHHADGGATSKPWDGFHTYAFELTPTSAAVFVDDVKVATYTPQSHPTLWNTEYFGSPLHVRLNLHVGPSATYWGLPDPANKEWTQPLDYQVDYVKIWSYRG
jgi:beta-glucanase (GH16 family)